MNQKTPKITFYKIIRWIARVWTILVVIFTLLILLTPGIAADEDTIAVLHYVFLGMWLLAVFGLVLAWRWEMAGGVIALAALILRDMLYFSLTGKSFADFRMIWLPIFPPALLYMIAWWLAKRRQRLEEMRY